MTEWQDISTAPKDGTVIHVKRVYEGRVVAEGEAEWGVAHDDAPIRQPIEPDPLGRPVDYEGEADAMRAAANRGRWMRRGRMFAFPEPTHWLPPPLPEPPGSR